jgi:hypothetical protein
VTQWAAREHHRFEAAGKPYIYLVPSAAIFALDEASDKVLQTRSANSMLPKSRSRRSSRWRRSR